MRRGTQVKLTHCIPPYGLLRGQLGVVVDPAGDGDHYVQVQGKVYLVDNYNIAQHAAEAAAAAGTAPELADYAS